MSRTTLLSAASLVILGAVLLTALLWPLRASGGPISLSTLAQINPVPALPAPAELANFSQDNTQSISNLAPRPGFQPSMDANLMTTRSQDGLTLIVELGVMATDKAAQQAAIRATITQAGYMPTGSFTGASIGQGVWHTEDVHGGPVRGSLILVAYDGNSIVTVEMQQRIPSKRVNGRPVEPVFTQSDLRLADTLAKNCLTRLGYMGYTSHSPLPLAARKAFIQKRLAMLRHTTRKPAA